MRLLFQGKKNIRKKLIRIPCNIFKKFSYNCRMDDGLYVNSVWYSCKIKKMKELWEILVPASNNKDLKFSYEHHKEWDEFVKKVSGGVTIMKTAKGQWVSPDGKLYIDRVIPCRIICTEEQINKIVDFTIDHYKQEAVLAYRISKRVILRYKEELPPILSKPIIKLPMRLITEGTIGTCPECGSTEKRKYWVGGKKIGCISPDCKKYYKK